VLPMYVSASAVLISGVPLAQPRALIGGHLLSAILGTSISKLFLLLPFDASSNAKYTFTSLQFLASSLSTATSIVLMQMTGTSHPPAGATALIPILDDRVRELGWDYVWVVLLTSVVMGVVGMGLNNVKRRWPAWWLSPPAPVPGTIAWNYRKEKGKEEKAKMGSGVAEVTPARDPTLLSAVNNGAQESGHEKGKEQV
jgi:CBS-domain-containing membrane protein